MRNKQIFLSALVMSAFLSTGMFLGGCGGGKKGPPQQTLQVSVYKPFQSDTLVTQEYAGTVMAMQKCRFEQMYQVQWWRNLSKVVLMCQPEMRYIVLIQEIMHLL